MTIEQYEAAREIRCEVEQLNKAVSLLEQDDSASISLLQQKSFAQKFAAALSSEADGNGDRFFPLNFSAELEAQLREEVLRALHKRLISLAYRFNKL